MSAVGHSRLSDRGRWMAAVLACGEKAVLSHTSAAELWGIHRRVRRLSESGAHGEAADVQVTVPTTAGIRRRGGIVIHRSSTLIDPHCTLHDGIPVTTPARTLADPRPLLSPFVFAAALREAEFLRLPIDRRSDSNRARSRQKRSDSARARSEVERRMLAICRRHRLPAPDVNAKVDRLAVDFLWRAQQLVVEVDGWESHRTRSAFEEDRARDARLALLGHTVVRFTWRRVTRDPK